MGLRSVDARSGVARGVMMLSVRMISSIVNRTGSISNSPGPNTKVMDVLSRLSGVPGDR